MIEAKHTEGPWEILRGGNFIKVGAAGFEAKTLAEHYLTNELCVCKMDTTDGNGYRVEAIELANAHLISAAPDLLKALKGFYEYETIGSSHSWKEIVLMVESALNKAEGKDA